MINEDCWLKNCCNHVDCGKDFCMRKYKVNYLYDQAGISMTQRQPINLMPKDMDENNYNCLMDFSDEIDSFVKEGVNIFIHSHICGNGKTSWALKLAQSYIDKIWYKCDLRCKVLFINVPRFLLELKSNIEEKSEYITHIKENVLNCDLVIWDEIGTKDLTVFEHENVLSLINARLDSGKSNIYTSNLNKGEMEKSLGERLYSRIVNLSYDVELLGPDMREKIRNERLQGHKNTI